MAGKPEITGLQQTINEETKKRILGKAEELFLKYSFSRVTIDEIVRDLGMSKKTLYRYFPNKKAMIREVVQMNQAEIINKVDGILQNQDIDYMERLKQIFKLLSSFFSRISGKIIDDLKNHLPDIWKGIKEFKRKVSQERIRLVLNEGIEKGFFRKDIDPELILSIYLYLVEVYILKNGPFEDSFSIKEKYEALFKIFYCGVLTGPARRTFIQGEYDNENHK